MVHDKRTRNSLEINWNEVKNRLNRLDPEFNFLKIAIETPTLSPEEETELAIKMAEGDEGAKKKLIESNIRLVVWLTLQLCKDHTNLQDAFQEGSLGLIRAVENFDYQKGFRLEQHAAWWISHYIEQSGRKPIDSESSLSVERFIRKGKEDLLTKLAMEESILENQEEDPADMVKQKFIEVMDELTAIEQTITFFLYGLDGSKPLSIKHISDKLDISIHRVLFTNAKVTHRLQQKVLDAKETVEF